ncbi:FAD/NAD(P)-binding protein [Luedemannella helvata]|uniref:FAD/NAD(P)-binding protein n=1 Tax=Luedemannella helvata TaxID=349315 RepID=A0ABP4WTH4_9ACTN
MTTAVALAPGGPADAALPRPYRVVSRLPHTGDTATIEIIPAGGPAPAFVPGQFTMVTAFGVGEVPLSLSGGGHGRLAHTVRAVGAVTRALHGASAGELVGVRGPFGTGWDVGSAAGGDAVVVAGGIGLAPMRPLLRDAVAERGRYGRIVLLVGARTPDDVLFADEMARWRASGVEVDVTVDRPAPHWRGHVGLVTTLLRPADLRPDRTTAFVCGPEIMMRHVADALVELGVPAGRVRLSLERNMRCGAGWCGHCQLGPLLLCRDGPVVGYDVAGPLLRVREL